MLLKTPKMFRSDTSIFKGHTKGKSYTSCMYVCMYISKKEEVLGRTDRLLSLIRHGPHRKRRVQQFFYCCVYIRYRGNVSTEPLPSNDRGFLPSRCLAIVGGFLPSRCLATIEGDTHTDARAHTHIKLSL
jgi:hypothetical protein